MITAIPLFPQYPIPDPPVLDFEFFGGEERVLDLRTGTDGDVSYGFHMSGAEAWQLVAPSDATIVTGFDTDDLRAGVLYRLEGSTWPTRHYHLMRANEEPTAGTLQHVVVRTREQVFEALVAEVRTFDVEELRKQQYGAWKI